MSETNQQREGWSDRFDRGFVWEEGLVKGVFTPYIVQDDGSRRLALPEYFKAFIREAIKETLATERERVSTEIKILGNKNRNSLAESDDYLNACHDVLALITSLKEKEHTHDWKYIIHDDPIQALTGNYYQCRCGEKKYSL